MLKTLYDSQLKLKLSLTILQRSFLYGMTFFLIAYLYLPDTLLAQEFMPGSKAPFKYQVDRRIDNMGYWKRMAEFGLVPVAPARAIPPAVFKTSLITDAAVATSDSPDIPVTELNSTQSENSVFISPNDRSTVLNSNNSSDNPYPGYFFGADDLFSTDGGENWDGQIHGTGGNNMGDPSTAINSNGRWFVSFIHSGGGQALAYSNDSGATWKVRAIASPPSLMGGLLDKSHMWIDNSQASPYKGYMYDGWTVITGPDDGKLQVSRSNDKGLGWQIPVTISDSVHARSHNQGINIATGPNGEVYAVWAIYDAFPGDENALGFARSFNGGQSWQPAKRIIDSICGIRTQGVEKEMRVNSFPSMAVDNSSSPWRGSLYVVWANVNYPGINTGNRVDVYMIRSADSGSTWSEPIRINQDAPVPGKKHYFPWITCDQANGNLSVIFYDDRDTPPEQVETWVATSTDGGNYWQDFRVSDVAFTPSPVTGLSDNYFGDYLGIAASNGLVYPCWTDNRTGVAMSYVSPFRLGPSPGQPYIAYQSNSYNDTLNGNGNGLAEYGENAFLGLSLRNMGDQPDSNIFVTLHSNSPFLVFSDSTEYFGTIGAGETATMNDVFTLSISDSVPNNTRMIITVSATDQNDSSFVSNFTLKALSPEIRITDFIVDDSTGNNSRSLDPTEAAVVKIRLENPTSYTATNVVCSLQSLQGFVHVTFPTIEVGEILPGEMKDALFQVNVDTVTAGTLASFRAKVQYSGQETERVFNRKIGLIYEDWESGNFEKFSWTFGGNNEWKMDTTWQYEGNFCIRSGSIGKNQTSSFSVNSRALTDDSISFYRKVSSEARFDFLNFFIDNSRVGQWSGEMDWERVVLPVLPGYHNFRWEYIKDPEMSIGLDAAFVDFIEFPSIQYTTSDAGKDATIYECQVFACNGIATYYDSLRWTTTGTGVFYSPGSAHTRYTPSQADKASGNVTLILTVYGSTVNDLATDSMNLTILPQPTAYAGPDAGICRGEPFQVTNASATNYTSLMWVTLGAGTFNDATLLMPVYYPGSADSQNGFADLVLVSFAGNNDACGVAVDTLHLAIYPLPVIPLQEEFRRCTGYTASLDATTAGGTLYSWLPGSSNTPEITVDSAGTGEGETYYTVTVTGEYGCISSVTTKVVFENCSEKTRAGNVFFRIFPNPGRGDVSVEFFSASPEMVSYMLMNPAGASVLETKEFEVKGQVIKPLELQQLGQGTYVFIVTSNNQTTTQKLIII